MLQSGSGSNRRTLVAAAFAALRLAAPTTAPAFEAERAFSYLEAQCSLGPRVPGTEAHGRALRYLVEFLRQRGARVEVQPFSVSIGDSTVDAFNILARFEPGVSPRIMLCAHWDSRPWADSDPDSASRGRPVPGANDGASGVAVLMELANSIASEVPLYGVDIVLFDAEDMGGRHGLDYALGSSYFAARLESKPQAAILVDMVGDSELELPPELHSQRLAPSLADAVWACARELGLKAFSLGEPRLIYDDHVPLLAAGVAAVAIIDLDYPYWHTLQDTPDKCSPASLAVVGTLLERLIYSEDALLGPGRPQN